jgi:hypothetical protein
MNIESLSSLFKNKTIHFPFFKKIQKRRLLNIKVLYHEKIS